MPINTNFCNELVSRRVRLWIERVVVGLNLCPFAKPLVSSDILRVAVCSSSANEDIAELVVT